MMVGFGPPFDGVDVGVCCMWGMRWGFWATWPFWVIWRGLDPKQICVPTTWLWGPVHLSSHLVWKGVTEKSPKKKLLDLDLVRGSVTFIHKWGTGRSLFTFFSRWFLAANHQIWLLSPQWWMPVHVHPSRNKPCTSDNFGASHAMKTAWQKCCKWFVVGAEQWRCESIGRPKSVSWAGRIFWVKVTKRTTCPFWLHRILENCYPLSFVVCLTQQPLTYSYLCYLQSYVINSIRGLTHNFQRRLNLLIDILPAWKWLSRYVVFSGQVSHLRQRRFARLSCWGFFNMGTLVNRSLWADALKLWVQ